MRSEEHLLVEEQSISLKDSETSSKSEYIKNTSEEIATDKPRCLDDDYEVVYKRPKTLVDVSMHYCPGCAHSLVHKLIMEVVDEMGIQETTVGVAPVGCSVFAYDYMNIDMTEAAHGRATAVATGIKRLMPDKYVFTYQGDGDLAAIGIAETIHAINRGENFMIVFMNNAVYGMTSGQMAPTTLAGMKTTTSPLGRDTAFYGEPIRVSELISHLPGSFYVTRQAVNSATAVRKAKKAISNAFKYQKLRKGTCFVEIIGNCPSNWKMTPIEAAKFVDESMIKTFPLGDIKLPKGEDLKLLQEDK
ncbi:MAG: 2-oxoglutarate oxidoreductase [Ignavibacteria bacterium]|nr:2-oxoglutarate oxidoreductase [Ignavibacteria bacterium]